jgi:non-heme chloroperoxidase
MPVSDLYGTDRTAALVKFDRPTLIIASADSPELAAQKGMLAKLPKDQFTSVAQAGHAVFVDQPSKFDELLQHFLHELP